MMEAGKRDVRIRIERKATTQDPTYGTDVVQWAPHVELWTEWQDILPSRAESVTQGLAVARNQSRLRFPWRDDIDSSMRVVRLDNDKVFQIVGGPAELGAREGIEVVVERTST